MVLCGSCRQPCDDDAQFCPNCGDPVGLNAEDPGITSPLRPTAPLAARADDSALGPGDTLAGYVVDGVAGRGGMGLVYLARDPQLGRLVALKVIAPTLAGDPGFRKRFEREWRMAAELEHPNVVSVYRAGEDSGRLYLAMRYIDGVSLEAVLDEGARLSPEQAAAVVEQVAQALDAAHAGGLVHRDVKPANVLLEGAGVEGRAYLADFGLTVRPDAPSRLTRTGLFVGTVAYAAPEQLRASGVDARTDVYALGGVLYHCLTGSLPYPAQQEVEAVSAHLNEPPPRPTAVVSGLPSAFDRVVARAMAKEPADRYPSAGDLARAALAAAHGDRLPRSTGSVATGMAAPVSARTGRQVAVRGRTLAVLGGAAAVAAAILAVGLLRGGESPAPPANPAGEPLGEPIRVPVPPNEVVTAGGFVWTMSNESGGLVRVDPVGRIVRSFSAPVGGGPFPDLATGAGVLWATEASPGGGGVAKVDPRTGEGLARAALAGAEAVTATAQEVWATTSVPRRRGTVVRLDPTTARVVAGPVSAGRELVAISAGAGSLWVADRRSDVVLRIDPRNLRLQERVPVGDGPGALAADDRAVWVANLNDRTLSRIDARTAQLGGAPVALGKEIEDLALSPQGLWVAAADSTLSRLDTRSGAMIGTPIPVDRPPLALAPTGDGVWVASASERTVQRIRSGG